MKILVVSQNFYPDNFKINQIVQEFVKKGNEVDVLTGLPDYANGKASKDYRFFKKRKEAYHGAMVFRVPIVYRRTGAIFRSLNYLSFALTGWLWALFHRKKYDVVYVYQTSPVTMGVPAIRAARKSKAKLVLYCLDIWPESVQAMNISEGSFPFFLIGKISRYIYSKADVISVSSPYFCQYLNKEHQINENKMVFIPQHSEQIKVEVSNEEPTNTVNFLFAGNIGTVQDVEVIIEAASSIRNEDFKVHIVGNGTNLAKCEKLVIENNMSDKIIFYGRHPYEEMPNFYQFTDVCLLTLKNNKIGQTIPTKLQDYMSAGKAIAAAINGDAQQIIKDANCGLFAEASDVDGLAKVMQKMIADPTQNAIYGENAKEYFESHFTKESFIQKTIASFDL